MAIRSSFIIGLFPGFEPPPGGKADEPVRWMRAGLIENPKRVKSFGAE
jgi:hypothetical protein